MIAQAEFLRLQHPCGYCGTRIRDVLPLELSPVCDWFPTQAPALQSLFRIFHLIGPFVASLSPWIASLFSMY